MNKKQHAVFIFTCLFLAHAALCAGREEPISPEALLSRARLQGEIWTDGMPPMLMRANLEVMDSKGAMVHGDYTLNWASPSQWSEAIRFANYERVRVRDAKGYWQKSTINYQPEIIFQLDKLLHLREVLKVGSKQTFGKVRSHAKAGIRQRCTEVKWTAGTERVMCFDEANGTLASVEYPRGENQNPPEITRIEYDTFNAVNEKLVPFEILAFRDRKVIAAVKVLDIKTTAEVKPAQFNIPVNAEFWAHCDDMQEADLVNRVQPQYPPGARANLQQGRVILYAVIEADGSLSHMTVIHHATSNLEAAAIEAVGHWHYKPAFCGQTPIRVETSIETDFWLQH